MMWYVHEGHTPSEAENWVAQYPISSHLDIQKQAVRSYYYWLQQLPEPADPLIEERYESPPIVLIHSPTNGAYANGALLNITVTKSRDWLSTPISFSYEPGSGLSQKLVSVSFNIDGKFYGSVAPNSNLSSPFKYTLILTNLTDGSHKLIVRAVSTGVVRNWISSTVYSVPIDSVFMTVHFILDATPNVSFLTAEKAYTISEFLLNFTES